MEKIFTYKNITARVTSPELPPDVRKRRQAEIYRAAAELLKYKAVEK